LQLVITVNLWRVENETAGEHFLIDGQTVVDEEKFNNAGVRVNLFLDFCERLDSFTTVNDGIMDNPIP
jgi:hypothetical protein